MVWENGIETCIISYKKLITSPGSMQDTGYLGLVHWDDPERWYREEMGGGFRIGNTCTPMFIAALFIIARTWKQPRWPSADEWIRKLWSYTMEYYSAIKKNTFESVLMRWMKLEPIIQSEVSHKERHQYRILMHIFGI